MLLKVIYDDFLRRTAQEVTVFDDKLKNEAAEMLKVMKKYDGLGLSGNQVGLDKRLIVIGYDPKNFPNRGQEEPEMPVIPEMALVNPKVVKTSKEKEVMMEGCLSLPGLELPVERSLGVTIQAQKLDGSPTTLKAKGIKARILQHEIDHLNGILFTDRATEVKKLKHYQYAKIVFLGSDDFSNIILDQLLAAGLSVVSVITETAKPAGRGNIIAEPVVKRSAEQNGVAVFQPKDKSELTTILEQLAPDLIVLASYGKILPPQALDAALFGSLNVHPSLLPKYRGATPIQSAILKGETETGVTIMTMAKEVDAGGLVAQVKLPIEKRDDVISLKAKLAEIGGELLLKSLPIYLAGQAKIQIQDNHRVSNTKKFTKEDGEIDWNQKAENIDRQIRALKPWPGTYTFLSDKRLKIISAHLEGEKLALDAVQLEGKPVANWQDFKRGYDKQLTKTSWFSKII